LNGVADSRLGRDVAVKMLPPAFAQDPERLARFEHQVLEAFALAALDYHRQKLAEASARLGVPHTKSPKRRKAA